MQINKLYIVALACGMLLLASCGIFKKDCNCPHFGYVQHKTERHS